MRCLGAGTGGASNDVGVGVTVYHGPQDVPQEGKSVVGPRVAGKMGHKGPMGDLHARGSGTESWRGGPMWNEL